MKDRIKILFGLVILLMVVGIISFSYALFTTKVEKKGALNIVAGTLSCPIESKDLNEQNQIVLQPKEEREIEVTLTNLSETSIHSRITYSGSNNIEVLAADNNEGEIELQSLSNGETRTYNFKLTNKGEGEETVTLNGRCGLSNKELAFNDGETEIEGNYVYTYRDKSGANRPNLVEGLIPVYYDESKSSWVKADLYKKWYDYDKQEWANAVTVVEKTSNQEKGHDREYYQTAEVGEPILIDDINTMWVWIPRYEYKYTNLGTQYAGGVDADHPGAIGINFINGTKTQISDEDNYKIHPAFTFGEDELSGFWYGKFETSNKEKNCSAKNESINNDCDVNTLTPEIKPNVSSWRGIRISTAFTVSQKMMKEYANEYGFGSKNMDTHISKNSEWGAVAYLSQSVYGKYGNKIYGQNEKEIYSNNCNIYTTGIAGDTEGSVGTTNCTNTYDTETGQKASTTGNITGIYDMSGGAWEWVMGALDDGTGNPKSGYSASSNSGFNGVVGSGTKYTEGINLPEAKYYDLYTSDINTSCTINGECYGHALFETTTWYGRFKDFVSSSAPWFERGCRVADQSSTSIFGYGIRNGSSSDYLSFRLVLVP